MQDGDDRAGRRSRRRSCAGAGALALALAATAALGGPAPGAAASPPETGIMAGRWTPPAHGGAEPQPVTIDWRAEGRTTGEMTFTLGPGGERFAGSWLLVEKATERAQVQPMYQAWQAYGIQDGAVPGHGWLVPTADVDTYVRTFDGHVVARLTGDRGHAACCHFRLGDTAAGIPGGGTGECQIDDGGSLAVRF